MTADAKVGLLLGLVFIAIIAFVFNGLPDFVKSPGEKPVVETAVTTQTGGGNLVIEPTVVDVARNLQDKRKTNVRYVNPPVDTTVLDNYAGSTSTPNTTIADKTAPDTAKTTESKSPEAALRVEKQALTAEPIGTTKLPEPVVAVKPQPTTPSGVSHVVKDGENLGEIARKYYGEQEGNKLSTIQMLYEANKNILESPDSIRVGDQLVIPKMKSAAGAEQTVQVTKEPAPASLMDKFKDVFTSVEKKTETTTQSTQPVDKKAVPTTTKSKTPIADKTTLLKTDKVQPVKANSGVPAVNKTSLLKTDKANLLKRILRHLSQRRHY
jgi:hypothetical protein